MNNVKISLNLIAFSSLAMSVGLMVFLFAESRNDPSLRIAALVAGTNTVASLSSIASTMLTGKDVTTKSDSDLPPNSSLSTTSTLKVNSNASDTSSKD